jgi:3-oxoacyl-[acyl-carrier protein] reductase
MRNVIVTGGNRGLGLGIARKLATEKYRVIAVARKETDQLTSAIRDAGSHNGKSIHFVPFDLALIEAIGPFVSKLRKEFGPIHGLVNNAGISFDGALSLMANSRIEQMVRLNTLSPIILTKYVVRSMMSDGGGRVVNVASIMGFTGYSGLCAYGATKASLIGFTRSLAREVGRMGVNVNSVAPGFIDTEMTQALTEQQRQQITRRCALKRFAEIEDVANAVEFLLGCKSKNITGTVLTVDAGSTA